MRHTGTPKTARRTGPLARFRAREDGVAAIEFAIIAPLLVMFLLGTTTATQSLWANGKVSQVSSVVGDLVSQETELDPGIFESIIKVAPVLMEPYPVGDMKITVTAAIACYEDPDDTTDAVPKLFNVWSAKWNGGNSYSQGHAPGVEMTDGPTQISIMEGDYIVQTRVTHTYVPTITQEAGYSLDLDETAYHQPRNAEPVSFSRYEAADPKTCDDLMDR